MVAKPKSKPSFNQGIMEKVYKMLGKRPKTANQLHDKDETIDVQAYSSTLSDLYEDGFISRERVHRLGDRCRYAYFVSGKEAPDKKPHITYSRKTGEKTRAWRPDNSKWGKK